VICDAARENGVDLIAISTHGQEGVKRWALGSVTGKVLHSSPKPILLVRAQEDDKGT
jgi:nucleotide-binding universal stress UspA family protein